MFWILSWRSLFSAKVSRWYVVGLLAIGVEVEEFWRWLARGAVCGWLLVGAGLASSSSLACEAKLRVLLFSDLVNNGSSVLIIVCP